MTAAKPAQSPTLSKSEVVAFLGKSKRTVETYIARGRLKCGYFQGANGKTAVFQRADVEALKHEIETPTFRAVPAEHYPPAEPAALVTRTGDHAGGVEQFARLLAAIAPAAPVPVRVKPWLTLKEAADFSGIPKAWLKRKTQEAFRPDGQPNVAVNFGTDKRPSWRFSRDRLKAVAL